MKSIIITLTLLCSFFFFSQAEKKNPTDTIKNVHLREKGEAWKTQVLSDPLHSRVYQRSQNPRFRDTGVVSTWALPISPSATNWAMRVTI